MTNKETVLEYAVEQLIKEYYGHKITQNSFWFDGVNKLTYKALKVLRFTPEYYSVSGLYDFLTDEKKKNRITKSLEKKATTTGDIEEAQKVLHDYQSFHNSMDEKIMDEISTTAKAVLVNNLHLQ